MSFKIKDYFKNVLIKGKSEAPLLAGLVKSYTRGSFRRTTNGMHSTPFIPVGRGVVVRLEQGDAPYRGSVAELATRAGASADSRVPGR